MIYRIRFEDGNGCHHELDCLEWFFDEDSIFFKDLDGHEYTYYRWHHRDVDPYSLGVLSGDRYITNLNVWKVNEYAV